MSNRAFLASLAGPRENPLHDWLADHRGEPRLAWYPSAGTDFRDVLYLHPDFRRHRPGAPDEAVAPDLYLHTDYCVAGAEDFLNRPLIHQDIRCRISVRRIAKLPRLNVPFLEELVASGPSPFTGRVIFLVLEVVSRHLGAFRVPVVYAFVENAAFCAGCLLPGGARISHVVQVRYGHGLGGGLAGPEWVRRQLPRLGTEVFVTDGSDGHDFLNEEVCAHFPGLSAPPVDLKPWPVLRELPYESWQGYGPVSWLRVPRSG